MSDATQWFIADPHEAPRLVAEDYEPPEGTELTLWGVLLLELADLQQVLIGSSFDPELLHQTPDGAAVFVVPAQLIEGLARLQRTDLAPTAERWSAASEHLSDWPAQELIDCLAGMAAFAARAVAEGKPVLAVASM